MSDLKVDWRMFVCFDHHLIFTCQSYCENLRNDVLLLSMSHRRDLHMCIFHKSAVLVYILGKSSSKPLNRGHEVFMEAPEQNLFFCRL